MMKQFPYVFLLDKFLKKDKGEENRKTNKNHHFLAVSGDGETYGLRAYT